MVGTPSDRVQVRDRGSLMHPGACALCGNGTCDEGYVDLDIYYDYEGQMYLCMRCAIQVAETIGCLTPAESTHLKNLNSELAEKFANTDRALANATERLDAINAAIATALGSGNASSSLLGVAAEQSEPEQPPVTDESASVGEAEQPVAPKPVKKSVAARPQRATVRDEGFQL